MALRKPASRRPAPRRKRPLRLALVGFGSVGRRFAERLLGVYGRELRKLGFEPRVTGIATAGHGLAVAEQGLPLRRGREGSGHAPREGPGSCHPRTVWDNR